MTFAAGFNTYAWELLLYQDTCTMTRVNLIVEIIYLYFWADASTGDLSGRTKPVAQCVLDYLSGN